ncbi:MAG: hypothetical protein C0621_09610 [Desulfuromonas sp.]|nr:MAG: hypothetical protein C0621_09610 [Desulfuromonas sp.]
MEWKAVLELGFEGGVLSVMGRTEGRGQSFVVDSDESSLAGFLSEDDANGLSLKSRSPIFSSLSDAFSFMDEKYPFWVSALPLSLLCDFAEEIENIVSHRNDKSFEIEWREMMDMGLMSKLPIKARKGSKPRCHLLCHGEKEIVAKKLSELIRPHGEISADDIWLPQGFNDIEEAQLGKNFIQNIEHRSALSSWWLEINSPRANTPNWDIASTCTIGGKKGLLLVEAKAHRSELSNEGKRMKKDASENSKKNHARIGNCIKAASQKLTEATNVGFSLSTEEHYQMSNRFAWAYKLTELGYPVILLYLGFIDAEEMSYGKKQNTFKDENEWKKEVEMHSEKIIEDNIWGKSFVVNGNAFIPLVRSVKIDLPVNCGVPPA